jgi:hypothetical protein
MTWIILYLVSVAISWCLQRQAFKIEPCLCAGTFVFILFVPGINIALSLIFFAIVYATEIDVKFDYKKFYRLGGSKK